jgi:hypothetical protein
VAGGGVGGQAGAEDAVELLLEWCGGLGQESAEVGQGVEQPGVGCGRFAGGELAERDVDLAAFGFEFGEPAENAGPEGGDGGAAGVHGGELLDFLGVGVFGGVDVA